MKTLMITNILWFGSKFIAEYEEKLKSFTGKYDSPIIGYAVFGGLLFLAIIFIKGFYNK